MIRVYIGEKANHTHENVFLERFIDALEPHYGGSLETITVIANALWNGAEIDAVCLLPSAIVVIDFKNYSGQVTVVENGPWRSDSGVVRGGSKDNPFAQVRDNKYAVASWIKNANHLPDCDVGHISGAVLFARPIVAIGDLGPKINSWFHVTDLDRCLGVLSSLASPRLRITPLQMNGIVAALGVSEYHGTRVKGRMIAIDKERRDETNGIELTANQRDVFETIKRFIVDRTSQSLSVLGMTSTGKTAILTETRAFIEKYTERQVVVLCPNVRIAKQHPELNAESVYSHIYVINEQPEVFSNEQERPHKTAKRKVGELKKCLDRDDCVYLVDDAHLVGNEMFELEDGSRFGSGRLANDFFEFANIRNSNRQVVFFGDSYQLLRGNRDSLPLFGEYQRTRDLKSIELSLNEMYEVPGKGAMLRAARRLVESIINSDFTHLDLEAGDGFRFATRDEVSRVVVEYFRNRPMESWWIAQTHRQTKKFNDWIRSRIHEISPATPLKIGDLLEAFLVPWESNDGELYPVNENYYTAGDRVIVDSMQPNIIQVEQPLKGRETSVPLEFYLVQDGRPHRGCFSVLNEFLVSEKPELESDTSVALRAYNAIRASTKDRIVEKIGLFRYGYASTAHHAQGMKQPFCFVDASYDGGRHNEGYFRWLYTAITRASDTSIIANYEPLSPFDESVWSGTDALSGDTIVVGFGFKLNSIGDANNSDYRKYVEQHGWKVSRVHSHSYQERIFITNPSGVEHEVIVMYNKDHIVTSVKCAMGIPAVLLDIAESAARDSVQDERGKVLVHWLMNHLRSVSIRVVGARRDSSYRISIVAVNNDDERARLEINHDGRGLVSAVRLVKQSGPLITEQLEGVFQYNRSDA